MAAVRNPWRKESLSLARAAGQDLDQFEITEIGERPHILLLGCLPPNYRDVANLADRDIRRESRGDASGRRAQ
jgi:hypothetical protein